MNLVLLILLIFASACFYATEMAIAHSNKFMVEHNAERGGIARHIRYVVTEFPKSLATILVGNDLVKTATSAIATLVALQVFADRGDAFATTVASLFTAFSLLLFGEILPKIIAKEHTTAVLTVTALPLRVLMICFFPIVWLASALVSFLSPLWKTREAHHADTHELHVMVEEIAEEGTFSEAEETLFHRTLDLDTRMASEIAIPAHRICAFDTETQSLSSLLSSLGEVPFSGIPVCRGGLQNTIGVLSTKHLLQAALAGEDVDRLPPEQFFFDDILKVPANTDILSLLSAFRLHEHRLILTMEANGSISGMITLSAMLRAVFGDGSVKTE